MTPPTKKQLPDPLDDLEKLPKRLKDRMFRNCYFYFSENTGKWTCAIEYGFGYKIFGTSKSLSKAIREAIKQVDLLLESKNES